MESHTDTATLEATTPESLPEVSPVDNLPDAEQSSSFTDALEAALSGLENAPSPEEVTELPGDPVTETTETTKAPETTETVETESNNTDTTTEESTDTGSTEQESKEATDPIEQLTEDIGEDWTPKAASRFKQLKTELKNNRSELDQMRQTVKEQEQKLSEMSGLVENRDIDQLQERIKAYEQERMVVDLESTEVYREAVGDPLSSLLEDAGRIAEHYDVSNDAIVDLIALDNPDEQDEALNELLPDISARDKARLYRIIEDVDPILERREHLVANAEEALQEARLLEEQQRNAQAAEQAQLRANITRNVAQRVSEKLPFLKGIENFDMSAVEAKAAEKDPTVVHPVDFAYNAVAAQILPTIVKEYIASRKEAESLTEKLAEYESAEPTMSGAPVGEGGTISADRSFIEAIDSVLGG